MGWESVYMDDVDGGEEGMLYHTTSVSTDGWVLFV